MEQQQSQFSQLRCASSFPSFPHTHHVKHPCCRSPWDQAAKCCIPRSRTHRNFLAPSPSPHSSPTSQDTCLLPHSAPRLLGWAAQYCIHCSHSHCSFLAASHFPHSTPASQDTRLLPHSAPCLDLFHSQPPRLRHKIHACCQTLHLWAGVLCALAVPPRTVKHTTTTTTTTTLPVGAAQCWNHCLFHGSFYNDHHI